MQAHQKGAASHSVNFYSGKQHTAPSYVNDGVGGTPQMQGVTEEGVRVDVEEFICRRMGTALSAG